MAVKPIAWCWSQDREFDVSTPEGLAEFVVAGVDPDGNGYPGQVVRAGQFWILVHSAGEKYTEVNVFTNEQMKTWAAEVVNDCRLEPDKNGTGVAPDEVADIVEALRPEPYQEGEQ